MIAPVEKRVKRHMWCISEELVPFALCDDGITEAPKEAIVAAMIAAGRPQDFPAQKPDMKQQVLNQPLVQLEHFAGQK